MKILMQDEAGLQSVLAGTLYSPASCLTHSATGAGLLTYETLAMSQAVYKGYF